MRLHPLSGLEAVCDPPDCPDPDGTSGIGLAVCLQGESEPVSSGAPPVGYVNPLRRDDNGCLYAAIETEGGCARASLNYGEQMANPSAGAAGTAPASVTLANGTGVACKARRTVTILNAGIEDPPASTNGTPADIALAIEVDGAERYRVARARTGGVASASTTIELPEVLIAAGGTLELEARPYVEVISAAGDRYPIAYGEVQVKMVMVCPAPGAAFTEADLC